MIYFESSPWALSTAGVGTFPPTREFCVDTVEVAAPEGTSFNGSDAGGTAPAGDFLRAYPGVDKPCWCIRIKFVTCHEILTCASPLVLTPPPSLDRSTSA